MCTCACNFGRTWVSPISPQNTPYVKINSTNTLLPLSRRYLFPEIGRRRNAYLEKNPDANIISLGIGDTTQPIPSAILKGLVDGAAALGTKEGYSGYGAEQGKAPLRERISEVLYNGLIDPSEVFVSDGAKCDIQRIQNMFGPDVTSAVQDPSYPVYVDTSVMMGQTQELDEGKGQYDGIVYMECNEEVRGNLRHHFLLDPSS